MPAPRPRSAPVDRSKTPTSHPASRSTHAAVRPPSEPPMTATTGPRSTTLLSASGAAERGDRIHTHLEQHTPLLERRVSQRVHVTAGVLLEDLVELSGHPRSLNRVVLGDLPGDSALD